MYDPQSIMVERWVKKLKAMPEVVGWHIDSIQGLGEDANWKEPILQAAAIRMKVDPEEIDWATIDPYRVVLKCSTKKKAEDFDWSDFEKGLTRSKNLLYPNKYGGVSKGYITKPSDSLPPSPKDFS